MPWAQLSAFLFGGSGLRVYSVYRVYRVKALGLGSFFLEVQGHYPKGPCGPFN